MPTLRFCWFVVTGKRLIRSCRITSWLSALPVATQTLKKETIILLYRIWFFDPIALPAENPVGPCRVEHMRKHFSWISWWKAQIWALQWFKYNDDLRWCATRFSFANLYFLPQILSHWITVRLLPFYVQRSKNVFEVPFILSKKWFPTHLQDLYSERRRRHQRCGRVTSMLFRWFFVSMTDTETSCEDIIDHSSVFI